MRCIRVLALLAGLCIATVGAGDEATLLSRYLEGLTTLKATFEQELIDESGVARERSHGILYLHRPGKFRWEYRRPYQQSIVGDGQRVWIYDKDLEQVTVKPLGTALGSTPALLLGGKVDPKEEFVITESGGRGGMSVLHLKPKRDEGHYTEIQLSFEGSLLRLMELRDNFGQTTRIRFVTQNRNAAIEPSLFVFTPPPGVDVIDAAENL
ncbi:MAG: outer membrane lipoprotein chaperone LolA [Gammaproteobacteria bacterium]